MVHAWPPLGLRLYTSAPSPQTIKAQAADIGSRIEKEITREQQTPGTKDIRNIN